MGGAVESDAKDGVAANNDYTDCEGDREPKKTGIDDILVDYFHAPCMFTPLQNALTSHKMCKFFEKRNWIYGYKNKAMVIF